MAEYFGPGVSRVLSPKATNFTTALWQQGKPPLDSELNLLQQISQEWDRCIVMRGVPSGWLGNGLNAANVYQTDPNRSNWFQFGNQRTEEQQSFCWAVVNGWLIPIVGTQTGSPPGAPNDSDIWNKILLDPPPGNSGDFRIDYVFLEVWQARIPPNPSATNKPSATAIWRYGNVEGGMSFIADDLKDPAIGFETTQRVQLQYRVRVVKGLIGLTNNADGFDPTTVKAQGAASGPTSYIFENMRSVLGDPGLWRAGDGTQNALGTVDGYSYAIPICAVFRRNAVPWNGDPSQNLNGSFNRNPIAVDRTGTKTFTAVPVLAADISATAMSLTLVSNAGIPLPLTPATPVAVRIGDEILRYSSITGTTMSIFERGSLGTRAEAHVHGATIEVLPLRPDSLFADQIARTDILDLRHVVNPNGWDYQALLQENLDKLLRGDLRTTWKYSGAGPQGPFVLYQDSIGNVTPSLGVTQIDAPNNFRQVFSDSSVVQTVQAIVKATSDTVPANISVAWTLGTTIEHTVRATSNEFNPGDTIRIGISQFRAGLSSADRDQIRFLSNNIEISIDGFGVLPSSAYTVTPVNPDWSDDLLIVFGSSFPTHLQNQLYIKFDLLYGSGRGLSRMPRAIHSVAYYNPGSDLMLQHTMLPSGNYPTRAAWTTLWSKNLKTTYYGFLPVTAETYADIGSKTVVLTPFRRVVMPTEFRTLDGNSMWTSGTPWRTGTQGLTSLTSWVNTITDTTVDFTAGPIVTAGMRISFGSRSYAILAVTTNTLTLDRIAPPMASVSAYSIYSGAGLMPLLKIDGVTPKWNTTDPLNLFSGTTYSVAAKANIYVTLPRHMVPSWGEVRLPIQHKDPDVGTFNEGVNYIVLSKKGASPTAAESNYVAYTNGTHSFAIFTTWNFNPPEVQATYNTAITYGAFQMAGMRHFNDTVDPSRPTSRGLGRKGLELPPFYGIARLFSVYEAQDYKLNGSSYDEDTREYVGGGAQNLLRQDFDGPLFWVELDDDGDSTFILNADAIDLSRSPNPISSFDTGHFVIEASIFGFDRGSFDGTTEFRLVLTRERTQANNAVDRTLNVGWSAATITGPVCVLPAVPDASEHVLITYSRTPYQGDVWGSQTNGSDTGYYPGSLTTAMAYQLVSTSLDQNNLTRPNEKPLEVLASLDFATTLGSGRWSGPENSSDVYHNVGTEDPTMFPPTAIGSPRPKLVFPALDTDEGEAIATEYLGATANLPLGALFRDKDFKGGFIGTGPSDSVELMFGQTKYPAYKGFGFGRQQQYEQSQLALNTVSASSGLVGDYLVHVDGNHGNYSLLTNFRTHRGGSLYSARGAYTGGDFWCSLGKATAIGSYTNVLLGKAMLVRNGVTHVGAYETSAGSELMLLVATTVVRMSVGGTTDLEVVIGTNGTGEGVSAADLYRLEGHPLELDRTRFEFDPSAIQLTESRLVRI